MQGAGVSWSPGSDQAEHTQLRAKWVSVSSSAALHGPQPPGNEECEHWDITAPGQELVQPELLLAFQHRLRISEIMSETTNICAAVASRWC